MSYTERVGAIPVLIVPAANDAGYGPNRSFLHPIDAASTSVKRFKTSSWRRGLEEQGSAASISRYRDLLKSQPGFAESPLSPGSASWSAADQLDEAYDHLRRRPRLRRLSDALPDAVSRRLSRGGRAARVPAH